jgi:hypothetical protein
MVTWGVFCSVIDRNIDDVSVYLASVPVAQPFVVFQLSFELFAGITSKGRYRTQGSHAKPDTHGNHDLGKNYYTQSWTRMALWITWDPTNPLSTSN